MKDKISSTHVIPWILRVITIGTVVASWFIVPSLTEYWRKKAELGIWQHIAMSDAHRNLATGLYELEQYFNELGLKYNCTANEVTSNMTDEELNKTNRLVQKTNIELAMMYMIMPDNKYKVVRDAICPGQTMLRTQREKLLAAMRKSQFPDTRFYEPKHIRFFHIFKRPDKEVKTQE